MKICVYTIALNEEQHVDRWFNSVADADYLIVGDTGSTDNTVENLNALGVTVYDLTIKPFRFDDARNAVLSLIPSDADVCVSLDMDEFMSPGWRNEIEKNWVPGATRLNYHYVFDFKPDQVNSWFWSDKIHSRFGYRWKRPVHETVFPQGITEVLVTTDKLSINQIQDRTKTTRSNYLPLLKQSHEENPNDSQTLFWYARELFNNNLPSADEFIKYLDLPTSNWSEERSEAMRMLSKISDTYKWLMKALLETDSRREIWLDLAEYFYLKQQWVDCAWAAENGLNKSKKTGTYLDFDHAWGSQLNDFASIAYYNLENYSLSKKHCLAALSINPSDERLKNNLKFIEDRMK